MNNDLLTLAACVFGAGVGFAASRIGYLETRCELLSEAQADVQEAIRCVDAALSSERTPSLIRSLAVHLLLAYADKNFGRRFVAHVFSDAGAKEVRSEDLADNEFDLAFSEFAAVDAHLAVRTRQSFIVLTMGLAIMYHGDRVHLMRVERETNRNPAGLWSRGVRPWNGSASPHHLVVQ